MTGTDRLDVLLIEDNPGDARLIEEMFDEAGALLDRVEIGESTVDGARLHHERSLSAGLDRLRDEDIDAVLLDLGLPESTGIDTLRTVTDDTEFVPIVVLTGLDDEEVGIAAIEHGAQDYLVKGDVTSALLVRSIHYALERNRQERERARRREQLRALNDLNRIGHDITHAVITTATREELEAAVCERLVDSGAYEFAWIGDLDRLNDELTPRATAGDDDGYLDATTFSIDVAEGDPSPAARAVETKAVEVLEEYRSDGEEAWRTAALDRGVRSSAAIPIFHGEVMYGVLVVYSSSPTVVSDDEREIFARLGDVIGHAITAIERKEALESDAVLELEFSISSVASELVEETNGEGRIDVDNFVRTGDDLLAYGRAIDIPRETFVEAADRSAAIDDLRILTSGEEEYEFELTMPAFASLTSAIATHGGSMAAATIADGSFRFVVEFPPGRDRRQLIALVEEHVPGAETVAQRTVERTRDDVADFRSVFHDQLTDKQRTALETAYFAGLFDWPRKSTGQEVADRLGVSAPTFTQHLRAAEQKFFDAVFDESDDPSA